MTFRAAWLASSSHHSSPSGKLGSRAGHLSANQGPAVGLWTNHSADSREKSKSCPGTCSSFFILGNNSDTSSHSGNNQSITSLSDDTLCYLWAACSAGESSYSMMPCCMIEDEHDKQDAEMILFSSPKCFPQIGFNR